MPCLRLLGEAGTFSALDRSAVDAFGFLLKTRAGFVGFVARTDQSLDSVRPGASTFPRIWSRSIGACENPVKGKTQNVDDFFVPHLYLVVPFRERQERDPASFPSAGGKLFASNSVCQPRKPSYSFWSFVLFLLRRAHKPPLQTPPRQVSV